MTLTATHIQDDPPPPVSDPAPDVPDISPVPKGEEPIPVPEPLPPPDAWGPRGLEAV
ncbi:hypothetical protein [Asticcacaulis taihuensis]|uniref:Uncharacterized protein n=1 Tax=Asticcacaulis taihuensis TaxID=260084 RepID=A0A1G4RCL5_9CAUL|nr:hypothetical protein [Asticcacaulis taihuensis]SCW53979.1 hypothetical protein SAMN02927928_1739 [Asticcacaulis taihuensis]